MRFLERDIDKNLIFCNYFPAIRHQRKDRLMKKWILLLLMSCLCVVVAACGDPAGDPDDDATASESSALSADPKLGAFTARPPHHIRHNATTAPTGLSPAQIRAVYGLPSSGGTGTIAIIDAYDDPTAENDLKVFSAKFGLPTCTTANGCFQKVKMASRLKVDGGWALEISLDVQWAHAIAPNAKILLVEARSAGGNDLLAAVDYACSRPDVVAGSMSWGGAEFSSQTAYDGHFACANSAPLFASSGDNGTGPEWPSISPNVIAVGGTSLAFNADGSLAAETAWSGSGGGISLYTPVPTYQSTYGLLGAMRQVPDVSYNADPASGFSVYDSTSYNGQKGWFKVGGTSAGAPQWAAIRALGLTATNSAFYTDAAASYAAHFRDVASGTNGACGAVCTAGPGYDTVTGLGSPVTTAF